MNASEKVVQSLQEARAAEDALVRVLQSQITITPAGAYRTGLENHLRETQGHSERVAKRIGLITGGQNPLELLTGIAESLAEQTLALAKTPLDLLRGSGGEEKVLKNARDAAATEALEIATYTALERLAVSVGDDQTAALARDIRADEQRMLELILGEIPALMDAVSDAQISSDPAYDPQRTGAGEALKAAKASLSDAAGQAVAATADVVAQAGQQLRRARQDLEAGEPWVGYDTQTVVTIRAALADVDPAQLEQVTAYESAHKNRAGVLKAVREQSTA